FTLRSRTTPCQPAPDSPVAKIPTDRTPHKPFVPWTEMAPAGSSTPTRSKKNTLRITKTPATAPMIAALIGLTNAHGAVIATSPASIPLHNRDVSDVTP